MGYLVALICIVFLFGVLIGHTAQSSTQKRRDRRQAEQQRLLNHAWARLARQSGHKATWWAHYLHIHDEPPMESDPRGGRGR